MPAIDHIQLDLLGFLRERRHDVAHLDVSTPLLDGDALDSLMLLDLILHIQGTHGVTLEAADVTKSNFCNVAALARLIVQRSERTSSRAA